MPLPFEDTDGESSRGTPRAKTLFGREDKIGFSMWVEGNPVMGFNLLKWNLTSGLHSSRYRKSGFVIASDPLRFLGEENKGMNRGNMEGNMSGGKWMYNFNRSVAKMADAAIGVRPRVLQSGVSGKASCFSSSELDTCFERILEDLAAINY
nr:hypothetical protein Iba_chr04aCG14900 [Ipomoea batatas]